MATIQHPLADRSLFIVTPNSIHLQSQLADRTVFECQTLDSILNARASKDKCGVIAVADGQIVLLHDETRGKNRKYKLKSGDGEPRLLLFSPNSRILYFTTTLSCSVQAYSIPTKELLSPMPSHPSPPNTIAISGNGTILLSTSPEPPTIYLQDRRYEGSAPLDFRLTDAHSAVSCAAFQKLTGQIQPPYTNFVLGFQDGTLAMYRVLLPSFQERCGEGDTHQMWPFRLQPVRVGVLRKLHNAAMVCAKDQNYTQDAKEMKMLVAGDATEDQGQRYGLEILIAVGTLAGKVLVFNILGLLIHEVVLDSPITAVEWVGDVPPPSILPDLSPSWTPGSYNVGDNATRGFSVSSGGETGTVKRNIPPLKQAINRQLDLDQQPRDLSFNDYPYQKPDILGIKSSHVLRGSPLQVEGLSKRPKQIFFRPSVSAETFNAPGDYTSHQVAPLQLFQPEPPISEARIEPQRYEVQKASRLPRFSALEISLSSSEDSECLESEWFTPNALRSRRKTTKLPARQRNRVNTTSPITSSHAANTPGSIYRAPLSSIMKHSSTRGSPSGISTLGKRVIKHIAPQRHVRIAEETPPPFNVPSSSYSRSIPQLNEHCPTEESKHRSDSQYSALSTRSIPHQSVGIVLASKIHQDAPVNTHSYLMPDTSQYDITTTSKSSFSLTGDTIHAYLDSRRAQSILVRNRTDQDAKSSTLITVASQPLRPRSTSSAYSRSISGFPKDANAADGEMGCLAPQQQSSLNSPLTTSPPSGVVFFNSPQAGDGPMDDRTPAVIDMAGLREDNRVLRVEVEALWKEYRALKDLLLVPKS
ncbi:hypothetical protein PTT_16381 [Pyrenophora teres f. teres 0-1]|uniref:Uncharacterized protein n=1 Tax=Pyrenophora teres f. teres (strain 0-1) TaxID=861557 RepID=E3S272_PYRTT|nr:hypothetical protein PTT_16381 [Pyrenophora teres f. teres 0-1]